MDVDIDDCFAVTSDLSGAMTKYIHTTIILFLPTVQTSDFLCQNT